MNRTCNEFILRVVPEEGFDRERFVIDLANRRPVDLSQCQVLEIHDVVADFRDLIAQKMLRHGWSNFLRRQLLNEKVVAPGQDNDSVARIVVEFLSAIGVDDELIIVDPFLFARNRDSTYPQLIREILAPFAMHLKVLRVVTSDNVNSDTKKSIEAVLRALNGKLEITHRQSEFYHDRFWISSSRAHGLFVGTSLNGLGKKYAIVDRVSKTDVGDIVDSLVAHNLIPPA